MAKNGNHPTFKVQGNTVFPALSALLAAAVAFATTELNDAAILDAPVPLNVANCSDTLDETIDALALAILATELIDDDMDDMEDRVDDPPPAEAKDDSPPPTVPPPPAPPASGAGVVACDDAKTINANWEMSRRIYMVFGFWVCQSCPGGDDGTYCLEIREPIESFCHLSCRSKTSLDFRYA